MHACALENHAGGAQRAVCTCHHARHTARVPTHHAPPPAHPCARSQRSPTHHTIPPRTPLSSLHAGALENHASGALLAACTSHHAQHTVHTLPVTPIPCKPMSTVLAQPHSPHHHNAHTAEYPACSSTRKPRRRGATRSLHLTPRPTHCAHPTRHAHSLQTHVHGPNAASLTAPSHCARC
jgi:hypothetical protein